MKQNYLSGLVLLFFFIIGLTKWFILKPFETALPVLIFGAIFYFLKHPEKLQILNFNRTNTKYRHTNKKSQFKKKSDKKDRKVRRENPFTVIDGKKDDKPKYH